MTSQPRISIITIVRNGARFIDRCLASVQAQNYGNLEYLVLDGASTDGTQEIIERYRPILSYYHSRPDKGAYDATLQGWALATGDIIGLLHADDWLAPDACATLAAMHTTNPAAEIYCCGMQEHRLQPDGTLLPSRRYSDPPLEHFSLHDGLYCQGVNRFYSREVLKTQGYFKSERYIQLADRELYMRLGKQGLRKAWTDKTLYHFLVHPDSNSTGGRLDKVVFFINETAQIATDYLREETLSPEEHGWIADWYCFNVLRCTWFRLKAHQWQDALVHFARMVLRFPFRSVKNAVFWKMPAPYRAKP